MIIGVAVKFKDGTEIRLPKPNRHCHCFSEGFEKHGLKASDHSGAQNQGFYNDKGEYLTRQEAYKEVVKCEQELLPDRHDGEINKSGILFSEDVW